MKTDPLVIFNQFMEGAAFKSAMGSKGLFEQSRINERFYIGDQWHGAKCGNERPLVRHNVIKRIGDYKMSQILQSPLSVNFSAEGVPTDYPETEVFDGQVDYNSAVSSKEIGWMMNAFSDYYNVTAERVDLTALTDKALKSAYITGTAVLYTYWDASVPTGLFADKNKTQPIKGDINCEVLSVEDVVFGDPYCSVVQNQPYIIISSRQSKSAVIREARLHGADTSALSSLEDEATDGKITVYTKLFKVYKKDGNIGVYATKVTERNTVRPAFDTSLSLYPVTVFHWENKNSCAYGESEITYLIPNQIAINRMITANVWSAMTNGMPIMLVNGDTVTDKITNDPGQIIKVFGSNEDVAGAVKYIAPPSFMKDFDDSINSLINNTLTQSGANEVALGDSRADNATALIAMRDAALMPLQTVKRRFYSFVEELGRIWADFWISCYGERSLKLSAGGQSQYIDFNGQRYKGLVISAKIDIGSKVSYSEKECLDNLLILFEKGIIDRNQLLCRLPDGIIPDIKGLINQESEADANDGI